MTDFADQNMGYTNSENIELTDAELDAINGGGTLTPRVRYVALALGPVADGRVSGAVQRFDS